MRISGKEEHILLLAELYFQVNLNFFVSHIIYSTLPKYTFKFVYIYIAKIL